MGERLNELNPKTELDKDLLLHVYDNIDNIDKSISAINIIKVVGAVNDAINGALTYWQRFYVSKTGVSNGDYLADRFAYEQSGTMVNDCKRETTIKPLGANCTLHLDVTTAQATINAADYCCLTHIIEGCNINKYLINGNLCLGFWIRSPKAGIHCVSFRNDGKDRSYIKEITIDLADTLEYHKVTIPMTELGGTWDYEEGAGLRISWVLAAGTNYHTTKDAWQTANYLATSSQQNLVDSIANNFYIGLVTCNVGKVPIVNGLIDRAETSTKVQRYFEKSYNSKVDPGALDSDGAIVSRQADTNSFVIMQKAYATPKRVSPTVTWYSDNSGAIDNLYSNTGPTGDYSVTSTLFAGEASYGVPSVSPNGPDQAIFSGHFIADAEIPV